jgi:DNA helicase-2/ATP-dependent DNA helicase PcrA
MDKEFVKDFAPKIITLNDNYRSSKAVLSAVRKIFPEDSTDAIKEGVFELIAQEDENTESQWIIDKIKTLVGSTHDDIEGVINEEKIVVLARNKYVFNQLELKLKENNIPFYYKMTPGSIKFESELMKLFDLALRIKLNSQDILHKERLLKILNVNSSEISDLNSIAVIISNGIEKQILDIVVSLNDDGSNLKKLFEYFKNQLTIYDDNDKKMIVDDIDELIKHWLNYAKTMDNKSLHQFKNAMALGKTHSLSQHKGITLSTVHTMKGQEFDIVFLMGMDDETFPDYRAINKGGVELTQEKNNLYVAFTRAKRFLYVTWPKKRLMPWGSCKFRNISCFLKAFNE